MSTDPPRDGEMFPALRQAAGCVLVVVGVVLVRVLVATLLQ